MVGKTRGNIERDDGGEGSEEFSKEEVMKKIDGQVARNHQGTVDVVRGIVVGFL